MSRNVRTLGAGLLTSAWIFQKFQIYFVKFMAGSSVQFVTDLSIHTVSKADSSILGLGDYLVTFYTILCLGGGFLIAGMVWPFFEDLAAVADQFIARAFSSSKKMLVSLITSRTPGKAVK